MGTLGEFVKLQREKIGLSQEGLGRFVDISQKQISNIESDYIKQPHRSTLRKIAKALDCSYDQLLTLAGYQVNWQEAEILIDDKPIDEKMEEIVDHVLEKASLKIIDAIGKKLDSLEKKFISSDGNSSIKISEKLIPLLPSGKCGPLSDPLKGSSDLTDIPPAWDADFAFFAEGHSMEIYKIFDGSIVYVKKQNLVRPEDIAVIHVNMGEENYFLLKKCKGDEDNRIFLDGKGNIFKFDANSNIAGKVVKVLMDFTHF
ncbi:MAG: helix-turn-helix domain-containing protein [Candidatus Eremiobacterota bacterium]